MYRRKYDLFLSYNPLDAESVQSLAAELNNAGVNIWFDQWRLVPGQNWSLLLEQAMTQSAAIAVCIGPSGNKEWPEKDLSLALSIQQQDPSFKIIPILLPVSNPSDIPSIIGRMQFIDFTKGIKDPDAIASLISEIKDDVLNLSPLASQRQFSLISSSTFIPQPPASSFVPRRDSNGRDLVERLKDELAPERNGVVALWGAGGVGKTTLAAKTAKEISDAYKQRIVWINAQQREDFTLSTLLDGVATQLGHADLRPLALDRKKESVKDAVTVAPTLIVLDSFETIGLENGQECLRWFISSPFCSVLITTRESIEGARNIAIGAMSLEEGRDFLRRLIAQLGDSEVDIEIDHDSIIEAAEGNPLAMHWVMAQIDLAQDPRLVLDELKHGRETAVQRVFDRSFNLPLLANGGRDALLALSLFVPSATRPALAEVAGLAQDKGRKRLKAAIRSLATLRMIRVTEGGQRLTIEGLTRELAKSRLFAEPSESTIRKRFIEYFVNYVEAYTQATPDDLDALELEKDNILAAIDMAWHVNDCATLIRMMNTRALPALFDIRGYWDEGIKRGEQAVAAAKAEKDELLAAQFAIGVATLRARRGEYDEAERVYREVLTYYKDLRSDLGEATTLHQLGMIGQYRQDFAQAHRLYEESLEISKRIGNQGGIASTTHQLGTVARLQGNLLEARRFYEESLEIERSLGDQRGIALSTWGLGNVALMGDNFEEAKERFKNSLAMFRRLGDQGNIAGISHQLGVVTAEEGDRTEAVRYFREALDIFQKLKSPNAEIARRSLERLEDKPL